MPRPPARYYDGSLLDNFISDDSFVAEGIENQVSFALVLAQSDVMLSVQIWPLETFMDVVGQLGGLIVTISALVILIMAWVEKCGDKEYRKDKQRRARERSKRFAKKAKRLKNKLRGKKTEDDEDDEDEGDDEGDEDDEGGDEDPLEVLSARIDRLDASMFQQMLGALRERVDRVENKIWTTRIDVNLDGESSDVAPNGDIDVVFAAPHDRPE